MLKTFPAFDDRDDIGSNFALSGDAGVGVDGRAVFQTAGFSANGGDDLVELGQECRARAGVEFDGGDDVDQGDVSEARGMKLESSDPTRDASTA